MLANRFAGDAELELGALSKARVFYSNAIEAASALLDIEPENDRWQEEHAILLYKLALLNLADGELQQAEPLIAQLEQEAVSQLTQRPDDADWLLLQAQAALARGRLDARQGQTVGADVLHEVDRQLREILDNDPDRVSARIALVECLWLQNLHDQALDVAQSASLERRSPNLHRTRILALLLAGQTEQSRAEATELLDSGYRHPELTRAFAPHGISTTN